MAKTRSVAGDHKPTEPAIADVERRTYRGEVSVRAANGDSPKLDGYAAVFNQETVIGSSVWGFREQVAPGAFAETITEDDICGLFNHDDNQVLGRTKSGTVKLSEDKEGLRYVIDPPDTVLGRDLVTLVARGDINGSSFAFQVIEDKWEYPDIKANTNALPLRTLLKVRLFDVSPVTYPAYPQTSVSARAKEKAMAVPATQRTEEAAAARRDGNGATGGGDSGDVGGDAGGMDANQRTAAAIVNARKAAKQFQKATRALVKALDISHGAPSDLTGTLADAGGAALDSGRGKLKHKARKAARRALRDRVVDGDSGSGSTVRDMASLTMSYAARAMRRSANGAAQLMKSVHSVAKHAGLDLAAAKTAGKRDESTVQGGDAGGAGANKAALEDLDLRARELEVERLR